MRLWPVVLTGVLAASAALGWWLTRPGRSGGLRAPSAEDVGAENREAPPSPAPRRVSARVVDEKGAGLLATVTVYAHAFELEHAKCAVCGQPELSCGADETIAHVAQALRAGVVAPPVLEEVQTAPDGAFSLERVPPGAVLFVRAAQHVGEFVAAGAREVIELEALEAFEFQLLDDDDLPRADATVTLFEPVLRATQVVRPDRQGKLKLQSGDPLAWVLMEAPGALPWADPLQGNRLVRLSAPRSLVVKTVRDGAPIDADVTVDFSLHPITRRTTSGVARFDGLPRRPPTVTARAGALVSGMRVVSLLEREVEIELFEAGSLVLSLESEEGEPVSSGRASLSSLNFDATQDLEPGALVIFEHLPAGDFTLSIDGPEFVREERSVEIVGGRETRLSLTVRRPLLLKGSLVDAQGAPLSAINIAVLDESGDEVDGRQRSDDEHFEVEVPHQGSFVVRAGSPTLGEGEVRATVPGPPVVVRVKPRAVIEVRLRAPDGEVLTSSATLRPREGWRRQYLEPMDGGWSRNAALAPGEYQLTAQPTGFLPVSRTLQVAEGKVARVDLTLDPGASISGRVEREPGATAYQVTTGETVSAARAAIDQTDGTFELRGVPPGRVELLTCDGDGAAPKSFMVEAPSRGVVLRCPPPQRSHGRVLDERGAPVKQFHVNERDVRGEDGRFEIVWTGEVVIFAEGYSMFSLQDAGVELGDLTLTAEPVLEGEVVNASGAPVSGATVRARRSDSVRSDARGRFKVPVRGEGEIEVYAAMGSLSGTALARVGERVRVVLMPAVRVTGHIADRQGRGVVATINAESDNRQVEFRSDAEGNFSGELAEGSWIFNSRLLDGTRVVNVAAPTTHVQLGPAPDTCGITVEAPGRKMSVGWLLPEKPTSLDVEPQPVANAVSAIARNGTLTFTGVPCRPYSVVVAFVNPNAKPGAFELLDSLLPGYASELITLRGNDERLVLPAP